MPDKGHERGAGERIAELAGAQHGVVSAAQLYAVGLTRDQVAARVRKGWLHRLHRGVYAVGHNDLTRRGRWLAAVLAVGSRAVLSHDSAAGLWRIGDPVKGGWGGQGDSDGDGLPDTHVTVPGLGTLRHRRSVVVHRSSTLVPAELDSHHGIPVTTPGRTILDLGALLDRRPLERLVDEAERLRLCGTVELAEITERHRGEHGAGAIGRILEERGGPTPTRSELEERFLALCKDHRLPQPLVNAPLHDLTVDFLWEASKLVVEVDGRGHDTHRSFQEDRDRDSLLAASGYLTLRFTWFDVTRRAGVVAHRVRKVLVERAR